MVIAAVYFVIAVFGAVAFARVLDRQMEGPRLRAAWAGRTAEARCTGVRTEEVQDVEGVPVSLTHPTLQFRTDTGRIVAFEERQRQLDVAYGDVVTVYYDADAPEEATARVPSFMPRRARELVVGLGCAFALVTAVVLAGVL
ncbi:DUF3592 domain-containing protein [Streptomyces sp. SID2563]|uniref:DUF3592 domain-containing protein n=1 Tax=Streptomyces sp. SID2563 TaxID=2690255 RepID=UPI00136F6495|nr:DUF3592 domain-containing protein [Streptomyces sp. SID2563]MYW13314.1 DUF3592 domain-containing protein [Streptomyces sp. SID2563]MYW13812.1 DUF3592 domain-containing protein [Streptomyces sp. SID2563]